MAAPGRVGSRSAQLEEWADSLEPVPTACPAPLERPAEPGKATEQPGRSLWERICEEYEAELPPFPEEYRIQPDARISRKRTKFIACDFLTEWLYNQNPKRTGEPFTDFFSIPFVEQWLKQQFAVILRSRSCVSGRRSCARTSTSASGSDSSGPSKSRK
uniref:IQ motif containing K n=1 Tax=Pipistrellus kuhlii TaxID=59472 RepID=A0A7J7QXL4_PIPKU|nr:IQ motif containing K [Pipistrellus kuhlii]